MDTPAVNVDTFELRGNARLEDMLLHVLRNARAIVEDGRGAKVPFTRRGKVDALCAGIPRVA